MDIYDIKKLVEDKKLIIRHSIVLEYILIMTPDGKDFITLEIDPYERHV